MKVKTQRQEEMREMLREVDVKEDDEERKRKHPKQNRGRRELKNTVMLPLTSLNAV